MHAQPSQTQHTTCPGVPHTHARDLRDGSRPHAHSSTRSSLGSTPLNAWPMRTRNTVSVELMPVPHSRGLANVKVTGNTAAIMGHPFFFSTKLTSPAIHGGAHDYGARAQPCSFADTGEARTYIQGTPGHTMRGVCSDPTCTVRPEGADLPPLPIRNFPPMQGYRREPPHPGQPGTVPAAQNDSATKGRILFKGKGFGATMPVLSAAGFLALSRVHKPTLSRASRQ